MQVAPLSAVGIKGPRWPQPLARDAVGVSKQAQQPSILSAPSEEVPTDKVLDAYATTGIRAATPKIGTARRVSSAVGPDQVCLSLSRSLAAGLDWRTQLTLAQIQQHLRAHVHAWAPQAAAAGCQLAGHRAQTAAAGSGGGQRAQVSSSAAAQQQHQQQQVEASTAAEQQQEEKEQQQQHQQLELSPPCAAQTLQLQGRSRLSCSTGSPPCPPLPQRPATTGSSRSTANNSTHTSLPWHLAASLAHHEQVLQALHSELQCQNHQGQQQRMASQPHRGCRAGDSDVVAVVMQQQEVLQHRSAARAASAVTQLAARRQQWTETSSTQPPPYPVFLPDREAQFAPTPRLAGRSG